jgi:hypothetical protein
VEARNAATSKRRGFVMWVSWSAHTHHRKEGAGKKANTKYADSESLKAATLSSSFRISDLASPSSLRELFSYRHDPFEEGCLDALESATLVNPQHVSLDGDLGGHLAVMHSPQEATEYAGHMPTTEIKPT